MFPTPGRLRVAHLRGTLNRIDFTRVLKIPAGYAAALPVALQLSVNLFTFPSVSHVLWFFLLFGVRPELEVYIRRYWLILAREYPLSARIMRKTL